MNAVRRILILIPLTVAIITGASLPAWADYNDLSAIDPTTVSTLTVAAPSSVTVNNYCVTTKTTTRQTVRTDPLTGVATTTAYSSSSSSVTSPSNVQSYTTSSAAGPGADETTTTTVTENTDLRVTTNWSASATPGVSGYLVSAHLADGSSYAMAQTGAATLSTSGGADADYIAYSPRLSVTTLTSYGWTATTAQTPVLSC
ncbi:hypothetical protein [Blastococcus sp. CT_GayMR16]|uniref:hypothetical protein n=1 Tax=Blastococcus sp. CT_GayMR16 TaxID=2559607 RepID=UPI001431EF36|nr:hypothetical protein [Blastococcus sp. CT_GayMR16]